jgi:hypothetical protein
MVSATASMLVLTVALAPSLGWHAGSAGLPWWHLAVIAAVAVLISLLAAGAIAEARQHHPRDGRYTPSGDTKFVWYCLAADAVVIALWAVWLLPGTRLNVLVLVQSGLLTSFALLNMLGNGAWLHARRLSPAARAAVSVTTVTVFLIIYWSLTAAIHSASVIAVGWSFGAFCCAAVLAGTLITVTACATYVAGNQPYRTDYPPINGAIQDVFLLSCMWFLLAWLPQSVLANVPAAAHERWAAIGTILAGFLLLFGPAFLWILENNDTHVERQRRIRELPPAGSLADLAVASSSADRIATLPGRAAGLAQSVWGSRGDSDAPLTSNEFLVRLSGHTAIQNGVALLLGAATIVGIVGISAGFAPNAVGVAGLPPDKQALPTERK